MPKESVRPGGENEKEGEREREKDSFLHHHISLHSDWKIIIIGLIADISASLSCAAFAIMRFTSDGCSRKKIRKCGVLERVHARGGLIRCYGD